MIWPSTPQRTTLISWGELIAGRYAHFAVNFALCECSTYGGISGRRRSANSGRLSLRRPYLAQPRSVDYGYRNILKTSCAPIYWYRVDRADLSF